jgi:hypothetical protein
LAKHHIIFEVDKVPGLYLGHCAEIEGKLKLIDQKQAFLVQPKYRTRYIKTTLFPPNYAGWSDISRTSLGDLILAVQFRNGDVKDSTEKLASRLPEESNKLGIAELQSKDFYRNTANKHFNDSEFESLLWPL